MTQKVDVKATRSQSVGSIDPAGAKPARLRQLQVKSGGSGTPRITLTDGNGGATLLDITFTNSDTHSVNIPGNGIRFENDIYVGSKANITAMTFFTS